MQTDIRQTISDDLSGIETVLEETGLFPKDLLAAMIDPVLAGQSPDLWLSCLLGGTVAGFCFVAPEPLTEGTWNMRAIGVRPVHQGKGQGSALTRAVEERLARRGGRLLIVDTSGTDDFAMTRKFYAQNGYETEARIRDFWTKGDDKVTFRKLL